MSTSSPKRPNRSPTPRASPASAGATWKRRMAVAGVGGADVKARIDAILTRRIGLRLTLPKRFVLAAVAALSLAVPVVTGAIEAAALAAGQLHRSADRACHRSGIAVRGRVDQLFDPSDEPRLGMTPGRLDVAGAPLRVLVAMVFPLGQGRVIGWPMLDAERYTISAKMPDGAPQAARQVAIRNLLEDRFNLVTHQGNARVPIYNLVLARDDWPPGPGLEGELAGVPGGGEGVLLAVAAGRLSKCRRRKSRSASRSCLASVRWSANGASIGSLVNISRSSWGDPVIDQAGLTAIYDLTLKWTQTNLGPSLSLRSHRSRLRIPCAGHLRRCRSSSG